MFELLACVALAVSSQTSTVVAATPPSSERLCANLAELASDEMNGRSFRSDDGKRAAEWVAAKFAAAGAVPLQGRASMLVPVAKMPAASPNVVAWFPPRGTTLSGEFILVTAHYDHLANARSGDDRIFNGADDNASGVCGMIAVAEAMRNDVLDVGVVFVGFTGEEAGLVGSSAFVDEEILPLARIRAVFNMDMISRAPDGAIRLDGGPKGKVLVDLLTRLAPAAQLPMVVDTHADWLDRSDQGAFLAVGIPAVLFSCEDHEDYHKVSDEVALVDCTLAAKVATLVTDAVRVYAKEMSPRFEKSPMDATALASGTRVLRIGRSREFAPFWNAASRRRTDKGLDADVWAALVTRLGWKVEQKFITVQDEEQTLRDGEIDVIADAFQADAMRDGEYACTTPYLLSDGVGALVKKDSSLTASSIDGLRLAMLPGNAWRTWASINAPTATIVDATAPIGTLASMVENGEVDALLMDYAAVVVRAQRDKMFSAVLLQARPTVYAFRKQDAAIAALVSKELALMEADGTLPTLRAKYGFIEHRIIGQDKGRVVIRSSSGMIEWEIPCAHNAHDLAMLANGNVLIHPAANRIVELTPMKEVVWQWESKPVAPYTGAVEIHAFERLADGTTMIAESGNLRIIEVDAKGMIMKSVPLTVERPDAHRDTRRVRKTDAGNYLVCHEGLGLVREYDSTGAIMWEYTIDLNKQPATGGHDGHGTSVFNAVRLKNGNTLIAGGNNNRVMEVNKAKEIVWSIERDELKRPDGRPIHLCWVTTLQVMPNGNILFGNTHAGKDNPQMIEVTRGKRVVWMLDDWNAFGNDLCTGVCIDPKPPTQTSNQTSTQSPTRSATN